MENLGVMDADIQGCDEPLRIPTARANPKRKNLGNETNISIVHLFHHPSGASHLITTFTLGCKKIIWRFTCSVHLIRPERRRIDIQT
jgi:hypothetical protein